VCGVFRPNLDQGLKATDGTARGYKDFREGLDRKDIDAVVIATPDHWHALQMLLACQAGKDVYVERPTARTIEESKRMVEAARKYNRVVQVGTEWRSNTYFQKAVQLVQKGLIGEVSFVRAWNYMDIIPRGFHHLPTHGFVPAGRGFAGSIHFARFHYSAPSWGSSMRINCGCASVN
jgi:predicted dehydrogenase